MRRALAGLALLAAAGCVTPIPRPTVLDAQRAGVALASLEHGRQLYVTRCGSCHRAAAPSTQTPDEWARIVAEMTADGDADLSAAEAAEVLEFLKALAAQEAPLAAR